MKFYYTACGTFSECIEDGAASFKRVLGGSLVINGDPLIESRPVLQKYE